ncbi:unnamed protein product [Amaranthus hypochondriacus]
MISTSSSNWLDRLRSSRGFPTGEEPDLDRFLSSSSSGSNPITESTTHSDSTHSQPTIRRKDKYTQERDPFGGLLIDLFNMGGESSRTFSIKASRKQSNPRFCRVSSDADFPSSSDDLKREKSENGGFVSSGDTSLNKKRENENNKIGEFRVSDDFEELENVDLKSYTRNEVTIIDTSFKEWKSDKWVFRKNDEWKIKEKRSKCKSGKKKKLLAVNNLGDNHIQKLDVEDDNQMRIKMKKKEDEILLQQPSKEQIQNDKEKETFKEREGVLGRVRKKRYPCPRPPQKNRNDGSEVILIKSIPPSDGHTPIKLTKTFHKKRPKLMKIV